MATLSGQFGAITGVSGLRNFTVTDTESDSTVVTSQTQGGTAQRGGIRSWNGSINLFGSVPPHMPGEKFPFVGYTAPSDGVQGNPGYRLSGNVIVDSVAISWNFQTGEILNNVINFSGDLLLDYSEGAAVTDSSALDSKEVCATKLELNDTLQEALTTVTLTIEAANTSQNNSSTIVNGECWTGRTRGNINWGLSAAREWNVRQVNIGDKVDVKLYIDATDYYHLLWGRVKEYSGISVDVEGAAIVGDTLNISMDALDPADNTTLGGIILPGAGSAWWGNMPGP